jgi:rod shape-determining protein MreD
MTLLRFSGWSVIFVSLITAFILMILPLPHWAIAYRPAWVLLVVLYWVMALPHRTGVGIAWLNGLLLDILQGTLLGENALCFAILAYFTLKLHRQIRLLSLPLQTLVIFLLLLLNQLLLFWLQGLQRQFVSLEWFFGVIITSSLLWPWISMILNNTLKRYRLH